MAMNTPWDIINAFADQINSQALLSQRGAQALDLAPIQSDLEMQNARQRLGLQNKYQLEQMGEAERLALAGLAPRTDAAIRQHEGTGRFDTSQAEERARAGMAGTLGAQKKVFEENPEFFKQWRGHPPSEKTPPEIEGYEPPVVAGVLDTDSALKRSGRQYVVKAFNGKNYIYYAKKNETPRPTAPPQQDVGTSTPAPRGDRGAAVPSANAAPPKPPINPFPSSAPVPGSSVAPDWVDPPVNLPEPGSGAPTVNPLAPSSSTDRTIQMPTLKSVPDSEVPPEAVPEAIPPGAPPRTRRSSMDQGGGDLPSVQNISAQSQSGPAQSQPGRTATPYVPPGNGLDGQVYDSLRKAGFGHDGAIYMMGEVGRENSFRPDLIFGSHSDPHNRATNIGMFSWQKDRAIALQQRLMSEGLWDKARNAPIVSKDALDVQAEFARDEMSKRNPLLLSYLQGDVSQGQAARGMGSYLGWRHNDPAYAHHHGIRDQYINQSRRKIESILQGGSKPDQRVQAVPTGTPDIYDVLVA